MEVDEDEGGAQNAEKVKLDGQPKREMCTKGCVLCEGEDGRTCVAYNWDELFVNLDKGK